MVCGFLRNGGRRIVCSGMEGRDFSVAGAFDGIREDDGGGGRVCFCEVSSG